ncbi:AhpC/TSA family protein [Flavobacteriaceae bacterium F08102]|nr:AhpC/TSA family protein [Flavobacteriaceae bacterium F08102]
MKIPKSFGLLCILILCMSCSQAKNDNSYTLTIKMKNLQNPAAKVYMTSSFMKVNTETILDSASFTSKGFTFTGTTEAPKLVYLVFDNDGVGIKQTSKLSGILMMYLEPGTIHIAIENEIAKAVITGSPLNTAYKEYIEATKVPKSFNTEFTELRRAIKAEHDVEKQKVLKDKLVLSSQNRAKYRDSLYIAYIQNHRDSYFSLEALASLNQVNVDQKVLGPLFESLSVKLRASEKGVELFEKMSKKNATIGDIAPDFSQEDEAGNSIKLSDYRGSYVLIDFWASWCAPCRAENPNLVKAYTKYHSKGFEILAVSLDTNRDAWLKAIQEEDLAWKHVSDLKGFDNEVAKRYEVTSIPKNILVDPNGIIIGINYRGYTLEEKLDEIFE